MDNNNPHEPITDTSLAAFLYVLGYKIIDIDYSDRRAAFIFINSPEIKGAQRLYQTGNAKVDPYIYARVHKKLSTIARNHSPWYEGVFNA